MKHFLTFTIAAVFVASAAFAQDFAPKQNHIITLEQANKLINNFRSRAAVSVKGGYLSREALGKILSQNGCVGIRYYFARGDDGTPSVVWVGVDGQGKDMQSTFISGQDFFSRKDFAITLEQANKSMSNFRSQPFMDSSIIRGGYFWREPFDKILAQAGSVGINYYFARQDDGTPTIVLIGADVQGKDIKGVAADSKTICPPWCGDGG